MPVFFPEAESLYVLKQKVLAQPLAEGHETGVAGIFHDLEERLAAVAAFLPAAEPGAAHLHGAGIEKVLPLEVDLAFFQRGGQGDDLERGTRFVGHPDRQVAVVDFRVVVLVPVRLVGRAGSHGQDFARIRIHGDGQGAVGLVLQHGLVQLALHDRLDRLVKGELQRQSVPGRAEAFPRARHLPPRGVRQIRHAARESPEQLVVLEFQAGQALVVDAGEAEYVGGQAAEGVMALVVFGHDDTGKGHVPHEAGFFQRNFPPSGLQPDNALPFGQQLVQPLLRHFQDGGQLPRRFARIPHLGRDGEHGGRTDVVGQLDAVSVDDFAAPGGERHLPAPGFFRPEPEFVAFHQLDVRQARQKRRKQKTRRQQGDVQPPARRDPGNLQRKSPHFAPGKGFD